MIDRDLETQRLGRERELRQAVLLSFCEPVPAEFLRLQHVSPRQWRRLLHWLDISGLALYFLDRLIELESTGILPREVLARLEQNLAENTARMRSLLAECIAIHREFERAGLSYAILKGFSLSPDSVPTPQQRSQLDLDFLVAEDDVPQARTIVEQRGYRLSGASGRSLEFKTDHVPSGSLRDLYRDTPCRSVEIHSECNGEGCPQLLRSAQRREIGGAHVSVLAPAELFIGQGMHLFKHVCSEGFRTAHLIEFRRHVLARHADQRFWADVRCKAEPDLRTRLGLGLVVYLAAHTMGEFAPKALTDWTVDELSDRVRLWVERYGLKAALSGSSGSKVYLLLQRELNAAGVPARRPVRQALLPLKLPPLIAPATDHETLGSRAHRYRLQLRFLLIRLRFHSIQGVRYAWESYRWRRIGSPRLSPSAVASSPRRVRA
jgi:hypothetical protein